MFSYINYCFWFLTSAKQVCYLAVVNKANLRTVFIFIYDVLHDKIHFLKLSNPASLYRFYVSGPVLTGCLPFPFLLYWFLCISKIKKSISSKLIKDCLLNEINYNTAKLLTILNEQNTAAKKGWCALCVYLLYLLILSNYLTQHHLQQLSSWKVNIYSVNT